MDIWDIVSVIGAVIFILIVAIFMNLGETPDDSAEGISFATSAPVIPSTSQTTSDAVTPAAPTLAKPEIETLITPSQIYYDRNYFSYPLFIFPEYSVYFESGSDPSWGDTGVMEFAFMKENTGGVSQLFNVPYRIWKVNCTVVAETNPGYAKIKWMLVNARNGAIIKGAEFYGAGTIYKTVLVHQTNMYFVIAPTNVDYYTIKLETTENYL